MESFVRAHHNDDVKGVMMMSANGAIFIAYNNFVIDGGRAYSDFLNTCGYYYCHQHNFRIIVEKNARVYLFVPENCSKFIISCNLCQDYFRLLIYCNVYMMVM